MKTYLLFIVGFTLSVAGCTEKLEEAPAQEPAAAVTVPDAAVARTRDDAFIQHMHWHAEKLDELNFALADDDLEGAATPAYWLSRHDEVEGIEPELQPYVIGMRAAALAVESAANLDAARIASEEINKQCQGCHAAAGVEGG